MGKYTYIGHCYFQGSSIKDSIIATIDDVGFFACKVE